MTKEDNSCPWKFQKTIERLHEKFWRDKDPTA